MKIADEINKRANDKEHLKDLCFNNYLAIEVTEKGTLFIFVDSSKLFITAEVE